MNRTELLAKLQEMEPTLSDAPWVWLPVKDLYANPMVDAEKYCIDGCPTTVIQTDSGVYPPEEPDAKFIAFMRNHLTEIIQYLKASR